MKIRDQGIKVLNEIAEHWNLGLFFDQTDWFYNQPFFYLGILYTLVYQWKAILHMGYILTLKKIGSSIVLIVSSRGDSYADGNCTV